uniref:PSI domain-containing protein n=1 Tax=Gouania willdenowi TaxID=441366 RepID=A0A8C5HVV7_GOUWI
MEKLSGGLVVVTKNYQDFFNLLSLFSDNPFIIKITFPLKCPPCCLLLFPTQLCFHFKNKVSFFFFFFLLFSAACETKNGTNCEECLKNVTCLWCITTKSCVTYPVRTILPPHSLCPLDNARWGLCWSKNTHSYLITSNTGEPHATHLIQANLVKMWM